MTKWQKDTQWSEKTLHKKLKIIQRCNQKPYIEGQTIQSRNKKGQKGKQSSAEHYMETDILFDRAMRSRKSKNRQYSDEMKKTKGKTIFYKALHITLMVWGGNYKP